MQLWMIIRCMHIFKTSKHRNVLKEIDFYKIISLNFVKKFKATFI